MYRRNETGCGSMVALIVILSVVIFPRIQTLFQDFQLNRRFGSHIEEYLHFSELERSPNLRKFAGKIVVINLTEEKLDPLYFSLSKEIRANNASEVGTVVWLNCTNQVAGTYRDGAKGFQSRCVVTIIDKGTTSIIDRATLNGPPPPYTKSGGGDRYGVRPVSDIVDYIEGFSQTLLTERIARAEPHALANQNNATATPQMISIEATREAQVAAAFEHASSWPLYRSYTFDLNEDDWFTGHYQGESLSASRVISDGVYLWDVATNHSGEGLLEVLGMEPVSDYYVTVVMEAISHTGAYKQGLMFSGLDYANYYIFVLNENGQYEVLSLQNNQWQSLIGVSNSSVIRVGEANRLGISIEGATLAFYINDTLVNELDDKSIPLWGWVGLIVELPYANASAILTFDNFQLLTPHADQLILIESGQQLAKDGEIEEALAIYAAVANTHTTFEIRANTWNALCWFGSLWGKAAEVMTACDNAVQGASGTDRDVLAYSRSSRGIARALTGDYSGAIEDLQFFITWYENDSSRRDLVLQREAWIVDLEIGQNPFDEATLAVLRDE